jgi:hypothetical protein
LKKDADERNLEKIGHFVFAEKKYFLGENGQREFLKKVECGVFGS